MDVLGRLQDLTTPVGATSQQSAFRVGNNLPNTIYHLCAASTPVPSSLQSQYVSIGSGSGAWCEMGLLGGAGPAGLLGRWQMADGGNAAKAKRASLSRYRYMHLRLAFFARKAPLAVAISGEGPRLIANRLPPARAAGCVGVWGICINLY